MDYLPVMLDVRGRPVTVVGGGTVAARKVELLLRAGARVTIVAPELEPGLAARRRAEEVSYLEARFTPERLGDCALAIAAADEPQVNAEVSETARARGIPVNVVDRPELSSFVMPAIVDRSPLVVTVSSGGRAPVLARLVRARVEAMLPAAYGRLAEWMGRWRDTVKQRLREAGARRRLWEAVVEGPIGEKMLAGREREAEAALANTLRRGTCGAGEVYLVGAGPGDPDLLTARALQLMQRAEVIVYDRLVGDGVLDRARRDAERIDVGKAARCHPVPQARINQMLVDLARRGKRVLRLKGGDPFLFGRGGEEVEHLQRAGVPFQVVPGVTAALGCSAYAGIPLTHRDYAHACLFVTGHLKDGGLDLPWDALVQPKQTVVIYMGLGGLPQLCRELVRRGLPGHWPAALIEQGTTPRQRVVSGTLSSLPALARAAAVQPPTLVIVGEVVRLRDELAWFGAGPVPAVADAR
ncbi:MAG: uroporphyrinogen-III C-methyltransferase [Gammaproteobacteria bacterium]|nr:uroporphyrinogen-III C-methyltransferase [Gammaproteobacteria bacterium]